MDYIGEQLLPGKVGHFLIILSLVASLIATLSYALSIRSSDFSNKESWRRLGRASFLINTFAILGVFFILFFLIATHRYEYQYVYKNSGNDLEPKYILSSLWSASEGSFLLWALWQSILGVVLMLTSKKWEAASMTFVSFSQVCLAIMLLGIYFFNNKIGSSPFALFREQMPDYPLFQFPDYATRIKDGNGLNMLLQNYWMVIHPPVLFLGFASTVVPFSFAMGGIITRKYGEWIRPALPWALFSACILGVGIMMGAAWAYESLSFGGYWAWDPVENASLVPWLTLVAGVHTLIIYKHTGRSLLTSYLLIAITFLLILYSTFLTRSGILGETSVHSFADLGMNTQLYMFLYAFIWLPAIISGNTVTNKLVTVGIAVGFLVLSALVYSPFAIISPLAAVVLFLVNLNKKLPVIKKEESTSSREFWMFIGSLVIFFSALIIIAQTSIPVYNKLFNLTVAPPQEVEFSYNRIQIFIAIIIGLLTAVGQYLKYKSTGTKYFFKKIGLPLILSVLIASLILAYGNINYDKFGLGYLIFIWVAVACAVFAGIANLLYIWLGVKGQLKLSGPSVAHFGFALMLLGILISASKKEILSYNRSGINISFGDDSKEKSGENMTLPKGMKMDMGKYWVTYVGDSSHPKKSQKYFNLHFIDKATDENFALKPNAFINYKGNEGLSANPDARHYWNYDVFAYITALSDPEKNKDTASFQTSLIARGDTIGLTNVFMILDSVNVNPENPRRQFSSNDTAIMAHFTVFLKDGRKLQAHPYFYLRNYQLEFMPDTLISQGLTIRFQKIVDNRFEFGVKESKSIQDFLTLKVYKFPFINLLWLGTILMALGFIISMVRRVQANRIIDKNPDF